MYWTPASPQGPVIWEADCDVNPVSGTVHFSQYLVPCGIHAVRAGAEGRQAYLLVNPAEKSSSNNTPFALLTSTWEKIALLLLLVPLFRASFLKTPNCTKEMLGLNWATTSDVNVKLVATPMGPVIFPCVSLVKFSDQVPLALVRFENTHVITLLVSGFEAGEFVLNSKVVMTPPFVPF